MMDNTPVYGCDGCRGTLGSLGCAIHGQSRTYRASVTIPDSGAGREGLPDGLVRCPLCGDPERTEDIVGGVCLTCADGIAFSQNARRGSIEVPRPVAALGAGSTDEVGQPQKAYAVVYSNYSPAEIDSLWARQEDAEAEAERLGDPWHVEAWTLRAALIDKPSEEGPDRE